MKSYGLLLAKAPLYYAFRKLGSPKVLPINYTLSVTNACNSKCKTCSIWRLYKEKPELRSNELTTEEWVRIIQSLNKSPFWITISGGEPYIRSDLIEICRAICEICKPGVINIPTNGLLVERIRIWTPKILEACTENGVKLVINLSIDGVEELQDEIRGIKGNWEASLKTLSALKELKEHYPYLTVGVHTVISKYNIDKLPETAEYIINKLAPDHYVMEVAEERSELFNFGSGITPSPERLRDKLGETVKYLKAKSRNVRGISKLSLAFRLRYYELIPQILESKKQVVPCMASFASCHINPYGELWPCCVLGYEKSMGNLRDFGYDFKKLWKSEKAESIREFIRGSHCSCPLANVHYTNLLLNPKEAIRILTQKYIF
jgi:MoaA/NifB/PqqE/SkfB family radical SAM enzyme